MPDMTSSSSHHPPQNEHPQTASPPPPILSRLVSIFIKGSLIAIIVFLLPFVSHSCVSLLRPIAVSILERLWNVLRFLLITSVIWLSILNTQRKTKETSVSSTNDDEDSMGRMDVIFNDTGRQKSLDRNIGSDQFADEKQSRIGSFRVREASHQEFACNENRPRERHKAAGLASAKRSAEGPAQVEFQAKKLIMSERTSDDRVSVSTFRSPEHRVREADSLKQVETSRSRGSQAVTSNRFALNRTSRQSKSALDLHQFGDTRNISKRNFGNTSVSCDFGDDYSPEWLYAYPSPPPPPRDPDPSSDSEAEKGTPSPKSTAQITTSSLQTLAALRSLPVDIARSSNPSVTQSPPAAVEEGISPISPSPGEVNRKADAFIAKFHEQIRMQILESYERNRRW